MSIQALTRSFFSCFLAVFGVGLAIVSPSANATVPVGTFNLVNGTVDITFEGTGCALGIESFPAARNATINNMMVNLPAPNALGVTQATFDMAWNGGGQTSGTMTAQIDVPATGIVALGSGSWSSSDMTSGGVLVVGTGTAPSVPVAGDFSTGTISSPGPAQQDQLSFVGVTFEGRISTGCDVQMPGGVINATFALIGQTGTSALPPSEFLQAPNLGQFSQNLQRIFSKIVFRSRTGPQNPGDVGELGIAPIAGGAIVDGRSAGDGFDYPWGVWASYQSSRFEDEFAATAFDADSDLVFFGADFTPWENFVAGVAFGYESTDTDTTFNTGEQDLESFTVAPYLGAVIGDQVGVDFDLTVDLSIGFSRVDIDQFRTAAGARVTSSTDADRWFISSNLAASKAYGNWYLGVRGGLLVARDDQDGFTESDGTVVAARSAELGRLTLGGDASYLWGSFEPFASALYERDFERDKITVAGTPHPNDNDDVLLGAGLRWYSELGFTSSFEYNTVLGREDFESDSYSFLLRWDF